MSTWQPSTLELTHHIACLLPTQAATVSSPPCHMPGVVPVSSVSSVVGHADVTALLTNGELRDLFCSSQKRTNSSAHLRLTWKCPSQALAAPVVSKMRMQLSFSVLESLD